MLETLLQFFSDIRRFHTSEAIKALLKRVLGFGLYGAVLAFLVANYFPISVKVDTILLALLGTLLSLLLVFRTNTAYDRFWEGRKAWGSLVNHSRSFAIMINGMLDNDNTADRIFFAKHISAFAHALKGHLRDDMHFVELEGLSDEYIEKLHHVLHIPNVVANTLFKRAEELAREKKISDIRNIKPHHDAMIDILGACERIKRTPIPHSYGFYIKIFISMYVCLLPFLLVDKYGYYTIPAIMFAAYALMGIEMIAGEIEEPFGLDSNDLPLDAMARTIYLNVHEILGVEIKDDPVPGF